MSNNMDRIFYPLGHMPHLSRSLNRTSGWTKFVLAILFFAWLMVIVGLAARAAHAQSQPITGISTGKEGLTYYAVGGDIKNICSRVIPLEVFSSAGGVQNVDRVLVDKRTQYGLVPVDALMYKAAVDPTVKDKIKIVMPMYDEEVHIIVKPSITTFGQLQGKRVVVGAEGSGNWVTAALMAKYSGTTWTPVEVAPGDGIKLLQAGQVDAVILVAGKPVKALQDLPAGASQWMKLLSFRQSAIEQAYNSTVIPGGIYDWSPGSVSTYRVKTVLVTYSFKNQYMKEIGDLTRCIVDNLDNLQAGKAYHAKWREVDPTDYKSLNWPVHPAALKYLNGRKG